VAVVRMSGGATYWLHCNLCMHLASVANIRMCMTACGRVVCEGCCPRLRENDCRICRGRCQVVVLNSKAPQNVLNLFKDISGQLKSVFKNLAFQESQKQSILEYKERMFLKLRQEVGKQPEMEIARMQELLKKGQTQLYNLEQKEQSLRATLNSLTSAPAESRQGPSHGGTSTQMSSAFYAGMKELSPARNLHRPRILESSIRSNGSSGSRGRREQMVIERGQVPGRTMASPRGDFLQMKTPGIWNKARGNINI